MKILVTDVTEMGGTTYCVAGWDATNKSMIRPLPGGGNWSEALITKYKIQPGTVLNVTAQGVATGDLPHLTEDTPVTQASITSSQSTPNWIGLGAPKASTSLNAGFDDNLKWNKTFRGIRQGVYVPTGTQCGSLGAVNVSKANLSFSQPFDKLLAILDDGSAQYQLPVSSYFFKEAWRQGGVEAATAALPKKPTLHVRVGLARDFEEQPNKCYLMINGIL
jgi:hypothetical protein